MLNRSCKIRSTIYKLKYLIFLFISHASFLVYTSYMIKLGFPGQLFSIRCRLIHTYNAFAGHLSIRKHKLLAKQLKNSFFPVFFVQFPV